MKCKLLSKLCYGKHIEQIQISLTNNPKYFWTFVKNRQKSKNISNNITNENTSTNNAEETVNIFKSYFESVYITSNINTIHIQCFN